MDPSNTKTDITISMINEFTLEDKPVVLKEVGMGKYTIPYSGDINRDTETLIRLNNPPLRITLRDHGPWDMVKLVCLGCGKSELELQSTRRMTKCNDTNSKPR